MVINGSQSENQSVNWLREWGRKIFLALIWTEFYTQAHAKVHISLSANLRLN
jgi:hypothetical protein